MANLTPEQLIQQWAHAPHTLMLNAHNVAAAIGPVAVKVFQGSIDKGRMNTAHSPRWPARHPKSRGGHPLLKELGTLYHSIKWKKYVGPNDGATIYTDPAAFAASERHPGFCYAAIHNEGTDLIPKRQFIGDSTVLDKEVKAKLSMLFTGLP